MQPSFTRQAPLLRRGRPWMAKAAVVAAALALVALVALFRPGFLALPGGASAHPVVGEPPSPADVIARHYADLGAGSYEAAWQQLSPSAQSLVEFAAWADSHAGTSIEPSGLRVTSQSPTSATVAGDVTIAAAPVPPTAARGEWTLTLVDGEWRVDAAIILTVDGPSGSSASR